MWKRRGGLVDSQGGGRLYRLFVRNDDGHEKDVFFRFLTSCSKGGRNKS